MNCATFIVTQFISSFERLRGACASPMSMSSSHWQVDFDDASNWLEDIPMPEASQDADELQEYLAQPPERTRVLQPG
ncbi:hypothetical protein B0H13DRAFT_2350821 [Mycena leptocephala]|nr:hypothetical protein B0H13DRAFT_2350821 [Mycena leptocephala]